MIRLPSDHQFLPEVITNFSPKQPSKKCQHRNAQINIHPPAPDLPLNRPPIPPRKNKNRFEQLPLFHGENLESY